MTQRLRYEFTRKAHLAAREAQKCDDVPDLMLWVGKTIAYFDAANMVTEPTPEVIILGSSYNMMQITQHCGG